MGYRRGRTWAAAACAALVAASVTTGVAARTPVAGAASLPKVTIGYENNGADPEMVAIARHLFAKDMHARVTMRYFASGPAALAALASGALQFMTGIGNPPAVSALAQGVPLSVVWAQEMYTTDEGLVVRRSGPIHHITDLRGKRVALVLGSTSPFELGTALADAHVPASSVHFVNMTPASMVEAWKRGQIQAAYVWDPAFDDMVKAGGRILMDDLSVSKRAPIFNLAVVNRPWAKRHRAQVIGFVRAEQQALVFNRKHHAVAVREMAKEAGISVSLAETELKGFRFLDLRQQLSANGLGHGHGVAHSLVTRSLTAAARYLYQSHTLNTLPKGLVHDVDPSYVEAALKNGK